MLASPVFSGAGGEVRRQAVQRAYQLSNDGLKSASFDVFHSGSTAVTVMVLGKTLMCANVGDSRAVLGSFRFPKGWTATPLSRDHKPTETDERRRILSYKGVVERCRDVLGAPIGPARVWNRTRTGPGLAMSRSMGDRAATSVGVTCEPEILETQLGKEDRVVILGSDGLWEFMANERAVEIVAPHWEKRDAEGASEALIDAAVKLWKRQDRGIDDITAVVAFLNVDGK